MDKVALARVIDPQAWKNWDTRCIRKEFTQEELPGEFAEWLADHPTGRLARSLEAAEAAAAEMLRQLGEPSEGMVVAGEQAANIGLFEARDCFTAMLAAFMAEGGK